MLRTASAKRWGVVAALALTLSLAAAPAAQAAAPWGAATADAGAWLGRLWSALERFWAGAATGAAEVTAKGGGEMDPLG